MYDAEAEETDAWIAGHKSLAGYLRPWNKIFNRQSQTRWAVRDENEIESGELCLTVSADWIYQTIVCTFRQRMIYRLDIAPVRECHDNYHTAWKQNLPALVCGPHVHGWPENRDYVKQNGFIRMPVRRPIEGLVETLENALGWVAQDLNIHIAPDQRDITMPTRELI